MRDTGACFLQRGLAGRQRALVERYTWSQRAQQLLDRHGASALALRSIGRRASVNTTVALESIGDPAAGH
jgi:hypothetical protein